MIQNDLNCIGDKLNELILKYENIILMGELKGAQPLQNEEKRQKLYFSINMIFLCKIYCRFRI